MIDAAVEAVSPARAMSRAGAAVGRFVRGAEEVYIVGAGKASLGMAGAFMREWGSRVCAGVVVHGGADTREVRRWRGVLDVPRADHPMPTARNVRAARAVMRLTGRAGRSALRGEEGGVRLVVLLSGGASSHLALPVPGVTLGEVRRISRALMLAGADIRELNGVRKRIEVLKGGGLLRAAAPARCLTLAISDVAGDDPAVIGSGPTVVENGGWAGAAGVMERYGVWGVSPSVDRLIRAGVRRESRGGVSRSVKSGGGEYRVIARNADAVRAASEEIGRRVPGCRVARGRRIEGDVGEVAERMARWALARQSGRARVPVALVCGGETTVRVTGSGSGGRNQELALRVMMRLRGVAARPWLFISFGTDGIDGPTGAAGAFVTDRTWGVAAERGLDVGAAIARSDSHGLLRHLERAGMPCLIRTGPTGTNVADVMVMVVF